MKKILIYTLLFIGLITGCKKDNTEPANGQRPEDRVEAILSDYSTKLQTAPSGWKAYLYPAGGAAYSFYIEFKEKNRVNMMGDLTADSRGAIFESSYKIKANQAPSLVFDTYSYIHLLADPDPAAFGGIPGFGIFSDFEFALDTTAGDTIKMTGKLMESKMLLIKATAAESAAYKAGGFTKIYDNVVNYTTANSYLYLLLGNDVKVQTSINPVSKEFSMTYFADGVVTTLTSPYSFTLNGILLLNPLEYNGRKITELFWDNELKVLYVMVAGVRMNIQVSPTPLLPLYLLIGSRYTTITAPKATSYPGWSTDFQARRAAAATAVGRFSLGGVQLVLDRISFTFNGLTSAMNMIVYTTYGANSLPLPYPYRYTMTSAGIYKFTAGAAAGNSGALAPALVTLREQRINTDTFILDYFVNPANGQILGQFKSIEHPDFTFSGALQ
jgi:hypothetical protein